MATSAIRLSNSLRVRHVPSTAPQPKAQTHPENQEKCQMSSMGTFHTLLIRLDALMMERGKIQMQSVILPDAERCWASSEV